MKKRIIYIGCICVLLLVDIVVAFQGIEKDITSNPKQAEKAIITEDLNQRKITQKLTIEAKSIKGIKVKTATFDRVPIGEISVKLYKGKEILAKKLIKGDFIYNNDITEVDFDKKILLTPGEYDLVIDTSLLDANTPITFYINKVKNQNALYRDNEILKGNVLDLQYYTKEFSFKRLMYIIISEFCLITYTIFVIRVIRKSK